MNIFSQECNKLFRVGAKIRVGIETGNTCIFIFCLTKIVERCLRLPSKGQGRSIDSISIEKRFVL